jgi:hypothetical protein
MKRYTRKTLANDATHKYKVHKRWREQIVPISRVPGTPGYKEEWYNEQCGACKYYLPLTGRFGDDWGVCSNPDSSFDGKVKFEHDGCDSFSLNPIVEVDD